MNTILVASFSVYYVCDKFDLGFSGLLAVVSLGFMLNVYMRDKFTNE